MSTLKERIAALQALSNGESPKPISRRIPSSAPPTITTSSYSSDSPPPVGRLKDKIARFDGMGGAPVPRGSFGLGAPPLKDGRRAVSNEMWGNRLNSPGAGASISRSASLRLPSRTLSSSDSDKNSLPRLRTTSTVSAFSGRVGRQTVFHEEPDNDENISIRTPSPRTVSPSPLDEPVMVQSLGVNSPGNALTVAAVETLPSSPSFKPEDASSSIATDLDLQSTRSDITQLGSISRQSSPVFGGSEHSYTISSRGREGSVTPENSGPSSPRYLTTNVTSPSRSYPTSPLSGTHLSISPEPDAPRAPTPSYLATAASYFPARSSRTPSPRIRAASQSSSIWTTSDDARSHTESLSIVASADDLHEPSMAAFAHILDIPLPPSPATAIPIPNVVLATPQTSTRLLERFENSTSPRPISRGQSVYSRSNTSSPALSTRASIDTTYFSVEDDRSSFDGGIRPGSGSPSKLQGRPRSASRTPDLVVESRNLPAIDEHSDDEPRIESTPRVSQFSPMTVPTQHVPASMLDNNLSYATALPSPSPSPRSSYIPPTPISPEFLSSFPTPPAAAVSPSEPLLSESQSLVSNISSTATASLPSPPFTPQPSIPLVRSTSNSSSHLRAGSRPPPPGGQKRRPRTQMLIPGKWITSDDEDDDDDSEPGWANITVSRTSY